MTSKIAIVGSGPAGCYTAQALRKALPDAEITVIDRLPVPYGLVRYGVAPDHQGTKSVTRQFQRLFERQNVGFLGNLDIGRDLDLDDLRAAMDAVVLATGLYGDRPLAVETENVTGIYGSGAITRYWNGHPDSSSAKPEFGKTVAIVGNGNVAMDIARLLAKPKDDFAGSDIDDSHTDHAVDTIHIIGRSPLGGAKFDVAMLRELAGIDGVTCALAEGDALGDADSAIGAAATEIFNAPTGGDAATSVVFHSGWGVAGVETENGQVNALRLNRGDGSDKIIACDSIVTAIGFRANSALSPEDFPGEPGSGVLDRGLFATGWFRRGPQGTIPENRSDAQEIAGKIVAWLGENSADDTPGRTALPEKTRSTVTDYADWCIIDKHELAAAQPDRSRKKIRTKSEMLEIIQKARPSA